MTVAASGIDISTWHHADGRSVDWFAIQGNGYQFVMVKATQGVAWMNPWLVRDLDDARAAGLLVGAYHYYEPGVVPEAQVENFIGSLIGQKLEMGIWLDWEPEGIQSWEIASTYTAFIDKAGQTRYPVGTRCSPVTYHVLRQGNTAISRLWLSEPSEENDIPSFMVSGEPARTIPGIENPIDRVYLLSARGLNIFTAPSPRPTALDVHPIELPPEPEEEEDDVEDA
jgi:GH25 family lysozyme M1 (1,4-beta-N-acetylmuramidase)